MTGLRRRPVEAADAETLYAIFASTRDELALLPDALVRMQFAAQDQQYRSAYPKAAFDLVLLGDTVVGRLYVDRADEVLHVIDVSLLPEHRNAGIGTALLRELFATGKTVRLRVERANRARALYERLGFREIAGEGAYVLLEKTAS